VNDAVMRHLCVSRFAPTIAEIREAAMANRQGEGPSGAEAWGELMQAVHRHGYYHPEEGLAGLSPRARSVAEMIGWSEINLCEELGVMRGQFLRMYEQVRMREYRQAMLPPQLRDVIQATIGSGESEPTGLDPSERKTA
jgi:hypothetical protein